jgi:hypothetical protein
MLDAHAHGAGDNPDFRSKWDELREKTDRLRQSMRAANRSTEEYDKQIHEDVIAFLKAKGLSDAQTREVLAKSKSPLDAVQPYIGKDSESTILANDIQLSADTKNGAINAPVANGRTEEQPLTIDVDAMNAKLAAAGLEAPTKDIETAGHGLTAQKQRVPDDPIAR